MRFFSMLIFSVEVNRQFVTHHWMSFAKLKSGSLAIDCDFGNVEITSIKVDILYARFVHHAFMQYATANDVLLKVYQPIKVSDLKII